MKNIQISRIIFVFFIIIKRIEIIKWKIYDKTTHEVFKEGVSFQITLLSCLKHPHDFNDIQKQK